MDNLQLKPAEVDVSLAKKFIADHSILKEWPGTGEAWCIQNKTDINKDPVYTSTSLLKESNDVEHIKCRALARKIEENSELFCQLEYLLRNTDRDDVCNGHIQIMAQYIRLQEPGNETKRPLYPIFTATTPLYILGYVGNRSLSLVYDIITTSQAVAPICLLFHQLCCDVGLNIPLHFMNEEHGVLKTLTPVPLKPLECAYVISERSDVCSALEWLAATSTTSVWRVREVWVEESVLEEVMSAGAGVVRGCGAGEGWGLVARPYRTNKELRTLLTAHLVCLWCGDGAAAWEVAMGARALAVWINSPVRWGGPPRASLPLYDLSWPVPIAVSPTKGAEMESAARAWSRLNLQQRVDAVLPVVGPLALRDATDAHMTVGGELVTCVLPPTTPDIIYYTERPLDDLIEWLVRGDAFLMSAVDERAARLRAAGAPLYCVQDVRPSPGEPTQEKMYKMKIHLGNYKIVRSTFGTIFAN